MGVLTIGEALGDGAGMVNTQVAQWPQSLALWGGAVTA
jgi:hypothetical protein